MREPLKLETRKQDGKVVVVGRYLAYKTFSATKISGMAETLPEGKTSFLGLLVSAVRRFSRAEA